MNLDKQFGVSCISGVHVGPVSQLSSDKHVIFLILSLAVQVFPHIKVLEPRQVWLVLRERERDELHLAPAGVVLHHPPHVGVNVQAVEEHLGRPQGLENLQPTVNSLPFSF